VTVRLAEAAELVERVAEREVRHAVARAQAPEPQAQRLLSRRGTGVVEEVAIERRLLAQQRVRGKHGLADRRRRQREQRHVEPWSVPDLGDVTRLHVERRHARDLEPDGLAARTVEQEGDVLAHRPPALRRLTVIDTAELERDQAITLRQGTEVQAGQPHRPSVATGRANLTTAVRSTSGEAQGPRTAVHRRGPQSM
jgi:hypothetical protein